MASTMSFTFKCRCKLPHFHYKIVHKEFLTLRPRTAATTSRHHTSSIFTFHPCLILNPNPRSSPLVRPVSNDGGGAVDATPQSSPSTEVEALEGNSSSSGDGYVALFVRMLGLDNDPLDREQAIVALRKYAQGGKHCIDSIMQFRGCINLTVNLLKSDSSSTCEAAAGLLRTVSSVNLYRDSVAGSGAIEELIGILSRSSLSPEVKEQSLCTLWNLSVDEKHRAKIASADFLPALIKFLDVEEIKVMEAAGGVLANLALSQSNHSILVEAGVIPKLAKILKADLEESKVIRKEAKNALLELAKDEYYRVLIVEEGLVLVPLVGADAYKSFRPASHSWPSLPDGTEFERSNSGPSRYGASELLLGLNIQDKNVSLEEAKMNAIVGRSQQQFLARIGAIEMEDGRKPYSGSLMNERYTLLPWMDGVARLVLILGLEDVTAISRASHSIADAAINEHMRISFKEAGAVKHLVQLLDCNDDSVRVAVTHALERLSVSNNVCQLIEAEGAIFPLVNSLKHKEISENLLEKTMDILARILDPGKEMKSKFYDGPVNGLGKLLNSTTANGVRGIVGTPDNMPVSKRTARESILDFGFISCLADILKTSSPNLQRKAASILEYIAVIEPCMDKIIAADIEAGIYSVFQQIFLDDMEDDIDGLKPDINALQVEEAGLAISAASRLLTKLLDFEKFRSAIKSLQMMRVLCKVLKSDIPLHNKDWVAACLVKLESLSGSHTDPSSSINMEVALYETIPRLVEQIKTSFSSEALEAAVVELNSIVSKGVADCTRKVAAEGGIFPLVKVIEEGSGRAVEASLAILYNLSMDSENHPAIIAAGAVPALRRIVLSQGPEWMRALHLLRTLPTQ
ncbi:PREDICTED: uncharacterized protein LOC104609984 isoform X2 [Nelumbo nucifera]|uniref:Uncharacterized protein n=2 Tax=Nelumbo nucifera TaxID=4432 RepID=A0A822YJ28_NELNU|nr:PREDICTED: uncharacterized protein LOC104609984 isoform X2 [Nelumbo nucifera]DAD32123.1 TPA_asm: hypothetical protein HUJ06_010974 [Nelumbo nucifera]